MNSTNINKWSIYVVCTVSFQYNSSSVAFIINMYSNWRLLYLAYLVQVCKGCFYQYVSFQCHICTLITLVWSSESTGKIKLTWNERLAVIQTYKVLTWNWVSNPVFLQWPTSVMLFKVCITLDSLATGIRVLPHRTFSNKVS